MNIFTARGTRRALLALGMAAILVLTGCGAIKKTATAPNQVRSYFLRTGNQNLLIQLIDHNWGCNQHPGCPQDPVGTKDQVYDSPEDDTFKGCAIVVRLVAKGPQGHDPTEADSYFVLWTIEDFEYVNLHGIKGRTDNFGHYPSSKAVYAKDVPELAVFTDNADHTAKANQPTKKKLDAALKAALLSKKYPRLNAICSIKK